MHTHGYIPVGSKLVGEPALACPVCGGEYVHPVELECVSPGTERGKVTIDVNGVALDPCCPPAGRGTRITLSFRGECGHGFRYVLQFNKGVTLVSRYARPAPETGAADIGTIWRD